MTLDPSTLFLAFGSFSGVLLFPTLLFSWRGNIKANRLLGLVILTVTLILLNPVLMQLTTDLSQHTYLVRATSSLFFLVGPLSYLYVKACTEEHFQFQPQYWLHFVPVLLDLAYNIQFYVKSPSYKMAYLEDLQDGNPQTEFLILSSLKVLHIFIYFLLSQREIIRYRHHLKEVKTYIDFSYETWLRIFTSDLMLIVVMAAGLIITRYSDPLEVGTFLAFLLMILIVQIASLIKPEIFHGFPEPRRKVQYREGGSSLISQDEKQKLYEKLLDFMESNHPQEDPEITLDGLAEKLDTKRNYLSLVINELSGKNFMDFINSYRVEEAKQRLVDPDSQQYTILAVAFDVGFNSKSAFYAAFKKATGMTPSQYRNSVNEEAPV